MRGRAGQVRGAVRRGGGIINDPVLLRLEENRYWMALADSDALLWAKGVALGSDLDVEVREPDAWPLQLQGPKAKDVMAALVGEQILGIRYYWTLQTKLDGIPVVIPAPAGAASRASNLPPRRPGPRRRAVGADHGRRANPSTSVPPAPAIDAGWRPGSSTTAAT